MTRQTDGQCPECGDVLSIGARACACGWRKAGKKEQGPDLNCPFNDHGYVCGIRGSLSESLNGSGPWYCPAHFWKLKGIDISKETNNPPGLSPKMVCRSRTALRAAEERKSTIAARTR